MDNIPDGNLSVMEIEDIADEMMYDGDAQELVSALLDSGFIDLIDDQLFIHDWHDYIGKLVEKREKDAKRKRDERAAWRESNGSTTTVQRTSNGRGVDDPRDGAGNRTVPNLTIPKPKDKDKTIGKESPVIHSDNENLNTVIIEFISFRKQIKKPMTDKAISLMKKKLDALASNDEEKIAVLEQSILNGWQNIYELKDSRGSSTVGKTGQAAKHNLPKADIDEFPERKELTPDEWTKMFM